MSSSQPRSNLDRSNLDRSKNPDGLSWYTVPNVVKQQLIQVSAHWDNPQIADRAMQQALELAEDHPDVLVSAYRYFFYTHNNALALEMATRLLERVTRLESLPPDWTQRKPILLDRRDEPNIRLYLNAYAASGLICARLGQLETAKQIAAQVSEIETRNEFGGNVVHDILNHPDDEAEENNQAESEP